MMVTSTHSTRFTKYFLKNLQLLRLWVSGNAISFMKHLVKRNNNESFANLRDKQTECCTSRQEEGGWQILPLRCF